MSVRQLRVGQKHVVIGVEDNLKIHPKGGAAAIPWYLSGGIVAAYDPYNASSLANSYINIANPGTYDCTLGVAPTWANGTGWTSNGTKWLKTGIIASSTWSMLVRFNSLTPTGNKCLAGTWMSSSDNFMPFQVNEVNQNIIGCQNMGGASNTPMITSGVYGFAGKTVYRNGVAEPNSISGGAGSTTKTLYIFAINYYDDAYNKIAATITSVGIWSTTLSAALMLEYGTAMP